MPSLAGLAVVPPNPPDSLRRHYLGTDCQGRDVASRLLYGFRISIFFALFLVFIGQVIGTLIGSLQGYLGGRFDIFSQRFIEILVSIPFLYVVIILAALLTPSFWLLVGIMAMFQWISITFYMRTEMYREKTREYCLAAKSYGASHWRIIFRHLLPNCLTPLVTFTPFAVVGAIFALTGARLSRLRAAGADAELGPAARSGAAAGKPRQIVADPGAVLRHRGHAGPRRVHRRIGARGVRSQAVCEI